MATTNYQRGYNFERYVFKLLEERGFHVFRSAGSHTPVDLIAFNADGFYLIQLKTSVNDAFPSLRDLLSPTSTVKVEKFGGYVTEQIPSNVKLLEDMYVNASKIILWKGKGKQNIVQLNYLDRSKKWIWTRNTIVGDFQ